MLAVYLRISLRLWDTGFHILDIGSAKASSSPSMLRPGKVRADWALEIRNRSARGGPPLSGAIGGCHCAGKGEQGVQKGGQYVQFAIRRRKMEDSKPLRDRQCGLVGGFLQGEGGKGRVC